MRLRLATILLMCLMSCASYKSGPDLWTSAEVPDDWPTDNVNLPSAYQVFRFEIDILRDALKGVGDNEDTSLLVQLPDPENNVGPFKVWRSGVVTKEMARKYPDLITYQGFRTSDTSTRIRMEVPKSGMQVMVMAEEVTWFISPIDTRTDLYMVYRKDDLPGVNKFWEGKIN